jgi:GWxTD domain-containing protein
MTAGSGLACASAPAGARKGAARPLPNPAADEMAAAMAVYERHGLIVATSPQPVVGQVSFLAGATADSTLALIALSYDRPPFDEPTIDVTRGGALVRRLTASTMRRSDDETAVFQQTITLAPGAYELTMAGRAWTFAVPRFSPRSLATPIPAFDARARSRTDTMPRITERARASAVVGRDTAIAVYLEAYGADDHLPVALSARSEGTGKPVWRDTTLLERHGDLWSGVALVPTSRLALGESTLTVTRGTDSAMIPLFVGFGPRVNAVSFDQLLGVLRYFAPPDRLDSLRNAPPERRSAAWAFFIARSDRRGEAGSDALLDYIDRVLVANERYRDEPVPGWETDRGSAYVMLGEPDQVFVEERRIEIWLYTRYFGRLVFAADADRRWRLTPDSRATLATLVARARSRR